MELTPATAITQQVEQPRDFDKDVLEPLRKEQALQTAREAAQRAEAERQVQLAYQRDLDATATRMQPLGSYSNGTYSFLQCVWYVAGRVPVPAYLGNAKNWLYSLPAAGFRQGPPRKGAIGITSAGYYGHAVLVEQTDGDSVLISEYNYIPYAYSSRWVSVNDFSWFY